MHSLTIAMIVFGILAAVTAAPAPGGWGGGHEHHIIHVPYHVHTVHHHHVKKVPIHHVEKVAVPYPVHIIKKVPVAVPIPVHHVEKVHVPVHFEEEAWW